MGNYYDVNGVYHEIPMPELMPLGTQSYKGSSTKSGSNPKAIAKRRKKNKNKKTHR